MNYISYYLLTVGSCTSRLATNQVCVYQQVYKEYAQGWHSSCEEDARTFESLSWRLLAGLCFKRCHLGKYMPVGSLNGIGIQVMAVIELYVVPFVLGFFVEFDNQNCSFVVRMVWTMDSFIP